MSLEVGQELRLSDSSAGGGPKISMTIIDGKAHTWSAPPFLGDGSVLPRLPHPLLQELSEPDEMMEERKQPESPSLRASYDRREAPVQQADILCIDPRIRDLYEAAEAKAPRGSNGKALEWFTISQASACFGISKEVLGNYAKKGYIATIKGHSACSHRLVNFNNIFAFLQNSLLREDTVGR